MEAVEGFFRLQALVFYADAVHHLPFFPQIPGSCVDFLSVYLKGMLPWSTPGKKKWNLFLSRIIKMFPFLRSFWMNTGSGQYKNMWLVTSTGYHKLFLHVAWKSASLVLMLLTDVFNGSHCSLIHVFCEYPNVCRNCSPKSKNTRVLLWLFSFTSWHSALLPPRGILKKSLKFGQCRKWKGNESSLFIHLSNSIKPIFFLVCDFFSDLLLY